MCSFERMKASACGCVSVCVCMSVWGGQWAGGIHPSKACRLDNICALRPKRGDFLMQMRPR